MLEAFGRIRFFNQKGDGRLQIRDNKIIGFCFIFQIVKFDCHGKNYKYQKISLANHKKALRLEGLFLFKILLVFFLVFIHK